MNKFWEAPPSANAVRERGQAAGSLRQNLDSPRIVGVEFFHQSVKSTSASSIQGCSKAEFQSFKFFYPPRLGWALLAVAVGEGTGRACESGLWLCIRRFQKCEVSDACGVRTAVWQPASAKVAELRQ